MASLLKTICYIYLITYAKLEPTPKSQLDLDSLASIGVVDAGKYNYKLMTTGSEKLMVIKLVPNITYATNCNLTAHTAYTKMIERLLTPINQSLYEMRSVITERDGGTIFWGAIIAGAALGVATAAAITAGVALHRAEQNARNIAALKDALRNSNEAIQHLKDAQGHTVLAIQGLQEQINNNIIPKLKESHCLGVNNQLGLLLNQYYSEILTVFGPNLQNPVSASLTIQAIAKAFNGDFNSLMTNLNYDPTDLLDILESNSINGRIIDVNLNEKYIALSIEIPNFITLTDAKIQTFNRITYGYGSNEWLTLIPDNILEYGNLISNVDLTSCVKTKSSYICNQDTSYPISSELTRCLRGDTSSCPRTPVVNSRAPTFALSGGHIYANCAKAACRCEKPPMAIVQPATSTLTFLTEKECQEVVIDQINIQLAPNRLNKTIITDGIDLGPEVIINPIDVSAELGNIELEMDKTQKALDRSNKILDSMITEVTPDKLLIAMIVVFGILLLWLFGVSYYAFKIWSKLHFLDSYVYSLRNPSHHRSNGHQNHSFSTDISG
ncbi:fusion protein [Tupaia paramyxovirus]|uniref:Fusion glycoprotein F0 n=1 Tax=Tupaia paramyxovirus TaxID=92129 RepID=Q9JFN5_TPMV|nr:fusion protein [Tupaia paramyxovirus]ASW25838.1 fusion protein [Vector TPMV_P-EGFP]ASW25845.1 fusion protein [Vector TPMV_P-EGFP_H-His6]ASW25852.1 fusion protein [Vector TPMV_P-EGFP_HaEGFR]ASW25859.1 fusion protein [Vector TPMV_P-EGFP_HaCD20]AAF63391.1 fusion protein [Tupaia paramyxovirus]